MYQKRLGIRLCNLKLLENVLMLLLFIHSVLQKKKILTKLNFNTKQSLNNSNFDSNPVNLQHSASFK